MKNNRLRSMIEELDQFVPQRDRHQIIEARANNVIASAVNLLNLISESFEGEEAQELSRRLVNAIKNQDADKFNRKIREYRRVEEGRRDQ